MPKSAERDFVFMVLIVLHGPWSCTHYMLFWANIWKSDLLPYLFHNENGAWHHPWLWLIALLATGISLLMLIIYKDSFWNKTVVPYIFIYRIPEVIALHCILVTTWLKVGLFILGVGLWQIKTSLQRQALKWLSVIRKDYFLTIKVLLCV